MLCEKWLSLNFSPFQHTHAHTCTFIHTRALCLGLAERRYANGSRQTTESPLIARGFLLFCLSLILWARFLFVFFTLKDLVLHARCSYSFLFLTLYYLVVTRHLLLATRSLPRCPLLSMTLRVHASICRETGRLLPCGVRLLDTSVKKCTFWNGRYSFQSCFSISVG